MSESTSNHVHRGMRSPTAVWILKRTGKRGTTYRIRWIDPDTGQTLSEACGKDLAHARTRRDAKKAEIRDGLSGKLPRMHISDLEAKLPEFMQGKGHNTLRTTRRSLKDLSEHCGDLLLTKVSRQTVMAFRSKRMDKGTSTATVNKDLRQIRSALSYAVDAGWLRTNPLWRWKKMALREPERQIRVVEPAEFKKLIEACGKDEVFKALLIVGYYQGLRRTELVNLRWTAINLDAGILRVVNVVEAAELTKSRKNRTLPMREAARAALRGLYEKAAKVVEGGTIQLKHPHVFTWANGQPLKADWVTHEFERVMKRAGITPCTIHDLRRSFSTLAQRAGVDKHTVKDLGGWSAVSVVEKHYTGEVPEALARAVATLEKAEAVAG